MRNETLFSRHAAHEKKIVAINNGAFWSAQLQLNSKRRPHVGKFNSELSQSFVSALRRS